MVHIASITLKRV